MENERVQRKVSEETRAYEEEEANRPHRDRADRPPTPEEEALAESNPDLDPEVAENYQEMAERGANTKGEGRI